MHLNFKSITATLALGSAFVSHSLSSVAAEYSLDHDKPNENLKKRNLRSRANEGRKVSWLLGLSIFVLLELSELFFQLEKY